MIMAKGKKIGGRDFVKGVVTNPNGRPKKGQTLTDILEKHGKKIAEDGTGKNVARKELLADMVWKLAIEEKDLAAAKYIFDRIDGTPIQTIRQSVYNYEGNPVYDMLKEIVEGGDNEEAPDERETT